MEHVMADFHCRNQNFTKKCKSVNEALWIAETESVIHGECVVWICVEHICRTFKNGVIIMSNF